jgi:hypothetical protein
MTEKITSFLDQYQPAQAPPEPTTVEPAGGNIGSFLDQYEQPAVQAPTAPDMPPPLTDEQAAQMTHGAPEQAVFRPEQTTIRPEVITESIKKGFADFAALPGYAVDAINWPLHKLGITPEKAVGSSDMIRKGWQLLTGYQPVEPKTTAEKYARTISEFAGGSVIPSGGIYGKVAGRGAPVAANAGPAAVREAYQLKGLKAQMPRMAEPASRAELNLILGTEAAAVVTGGAGAEFGGEIGGEAFGPAGRVAGQLIGGLAGGMSPLYFKTAGAGIFNAQRAAMTVAKDRANFTENVAKTKILAAIGDNPQAQPNIEKAAQLQKEIAGFNPNLAAASGSPGLAQMQARLDSQSIENYNTAMENIRKSQQAIDHYYSQTFSTTGQRLGAEKTFRGVLKGLKESAGDIDKQIDTLAAKYQRQPTEQIGARLRELRQVRKTEVRGDVNQAYDDLYKAADELGVIDDASDLYLLAQDFVKQDANAFQRMPAVLSKMRQVFGREIDPNVPFEDQRILTDFPKLHSLSRQVSSEYGKALKAGDSQSQYYLGQVKELLDSKLNAFDDPIYGTFAQHKKAVDAFWLDEYHNVFRKGVGGKIPSETRWGQATPDEMIVEKLVMQKGTARGINEFNKVYENIPEAQTLLRDGILDMFASKVIKKGKIDENQVRGFLDDYRQVFDQVEDMRNTFMNSDALTNALVNRKANVINKSKRFASKTLSPYAKVAGYDTPHAAVEAGLSDPKVMRVITRNAKTEAERQDLSSVIADVVLEQQNPWQYLLDKETQLAKHFNRIKPGHFRKLKNVAEAQTIIKRYDPRGISMSRVDEDPFYKRFGTTFASALSQWRWALLYNKTSVYYPAADMGSKYLNKIKSNKVDELMERALYDPDLATTIDSLSKVKTGDMGDTRTLELLNQLGLHAINNGIRTGVTAIPEEQQTLPELQ